MNLSVSFFNMQQTQVWNEEARDAVYFYLLIIYTKEKQILAHRHAFVSWQYPATLHTLAYVLAPRTSRVGHGVWKVSCCVVGDKDYFCTHSQTERQAGCVAMNSHHTVLNSTEGHKPHRTLACSFLKLSCLLDTSVHLLKGYIGPMRKSAFNILWITLNHRTHHQWWFLASCGVLGSFNIR